MNNRVRASVFIMAIAALSVCADGPVSYPVGAFIHAWSICGPFEARGVLERVIEDEGALDPAQIKDVNGVSWKTLNSKADVVDLESAAAFGPHDKVVAFAFAEIEYEDESDMILGLGSDDSVMAWWNGRQVLVQDVLRGVKIGEDQVHLRTRKGRNTLLLKIYDEGGGWGFAADLRPCP